MPFTEKGIPARAGAGLDLGGVALVLLLDEQPAQQHHGLQHAAQRHGDRGRQTFRRQAGLAGELNQPAASAVVNGVFVTTKPGNSAPISRSAAANSVPVPIKAASRALIRRITAQ